MCKNKQLGFEFKSKLNNYTIWQKKINKDVDGGNVFEEVVYHFDDVGVNGVGEDAHGEYDGWHFFKWLLDDK